MLNRFFAEIFFPQAQEAAHPRARRAPKATFPEDSSVLSCIIEYLYTGVIEKLENAPKQFNDTEGRLWIRTITWCSRHDITSVFDYVHQAIIDRVLSLQCAAELLAVLAQSTGAVNQMGSQSEDLRARQITELKELAVQSFVNAQFREDMFAPLSRVALKVLLQSGRLAMREYDIVRAVGWWASNSPWVSNSVEAGSLTADNMTDITCLLLPEHLTGPEFNVLQIYFPQRIRNAVRGGCRHRLMQLL